MAGSPGFWRWVAGGGSRRMPARSRPRVERLEARDVPAIVYVTTGADDGAGSLRAALEQANADATVGTIVVRISVAAVDLESSLAYTGPQNLILKGNGTTVPPVGGSEGTFDLLEASGGADLTLERLTFRDGLKGVHIVAPIGSVGTLEVTLRRVTVLNSVEHGLHLDDLTNATAAGVKLTVWDSTFDGNGTDPDDFDGIRVDERGVGGILAIFSGSTVTDSGGDGTELDERGDGDVVAVVDRSRFERNGNANAADLEDGFDIDEGGRGNIAGVFSNSSFSNNFEGGLDVNEDDGDDPTDDGHLTVTLIDVRGNDNLDKGLDFNEGNAGHIIASFVRVEASRNGTTAGNLEEGIVLEEAGTGNVVASFLRVTTSGNGDDGIDIDETGEGDLIAGFAFVTANDNGQEGIDLDEADAGIFRVGLIGIVSNDPLDVTD